MPVLADSRQRPRVHGVAGILIADEGKSGRSKKPARAILEEVGQTMERIRLFQRPRR